MAWAMDARRTGPMTPAARLVLITLADYAGAAGQAFPSVETIAARTGAGVSTIRRQLAWLLEAGIIRLGDQLLVSHYRPDRRPMVYAVRPIPPRLSTENAGSQNETPSDTPEYDPVENRVTGSQNGTPYGVSKRAPRGPKMSATGSQNETQTKNRTNNVKEGPPTPAASSAQNGPPALGITRPRPGPENRPPARPARDPRRAPCGSGVIAPPNFRQLAGLPDRPPSPATGPAPALPRGGASLRRSRLDPASAGPTLAQLETALRTR